MPDLDSLDAWIDAGSLDTCIQGVLTLDIALTAVPEMFRGGSFLSYPQMRFNGVLRAFAVGRYWDTTANATRCARRFGVVCGGVVVWRGVCPPRFSRPDRGGVDAAGTVGYDAAANRIDRPRDAAAHGLIPGETVRYPAQGVEGKNDGEWGKRLCTRSIGRLRAESRCESRLVLRESR